jgi:hypothetical protein
MQQTPNAVVMIRPQHFHSNPDTTLDNAFQQSTPQPHATAQRAYEEVTRMAQQLEAAGVRVHLFDDDATDRPDAVFPNNWFSTHAGGHVAIYPMATPSRQRELRWDVIAMLKAQYRVQDVIDYSGLAQDGIYLEGTGAMVLDHLDRVAYAVRSKRADALALERFCTHFNYEPMLFEALDTQGQSIYHTNVLMCIGTGFAMAGFEMISDASRRSHVMQRLRESGREPIELSEAQIGEFAGNALELQSTHGLLLALSSRAWRALNAGQRRQIEKHAQPLPLDVPTIELAGGSVRCMLAGIHLSPRLHAVGEEFSSAAKLVA